jgi:hypothetical protein
MTIEELLAMLATPDVDQASAITEYVNSQIETTTTGIKNKNSELLAKIRKLKDNAIAIPDGFDPDLWNALNKEHENSKAEKMKAEGRWDELKNELTAGHTAELERREKINSSLKSALEEQLIDNAAVSAITAANGNSALLLPHIKARLKMVQRDDGTFSTIVSDGNGSQTYSKVKAGEPMQLTELVGEYRANDQYAAAFTPVNSGGGAGGSGNSSINGKNPFAKGPSFSYTEQARINKANPDLAAQMKTAADG